jgi:hypothetical protein
MITGSSRKLRKLQARCDEWNKTHAVGTDVAYYCVRGREITTITRTRSKAFVLAQHTCCIFVEALPGCVSLDAVTPTVDARQVDGKNKEGFI